MEQALWVTGRKRGVILKRGFYPKLYKWNKKTENYDTNNQDDDTLYLGSPKEESKVCLYQVLNWKKKLYTLMEKLKSMNSI